MKEYQLSDYIDYRILKAEETYEVASLLIREEKWNSAVNRFYYACFYAVTALLAKANITSKSHSGIKTQFLLHYIQSQKLDESNGKLYNKLLDWRQKGDYGDFFDFTKEDVIPLEQSCRKFIDDIKIILEK